MRLLVAPPINKLYINFRLLVGVLTGQNTYSVNINTPIASVAEDSS